MVENLEQLPHQTQDTHIKELPTDEPKEIRKTREVSKYVFPYYDLESSIQVARELHNKAGGKASLVQLASYLNHKDEFSGAYRSKLWGAQLFGLVTIAANNICVTKLGEQLAADTAGVQRDMRLAESFLRVPLFREVYRKYENSTLPSTREGMKRALQDTFGVSPRLLSLALKSLERSAEQAGFKRLGINRLIHPVPEGLAEKDGLSQTEAEQLLEPSTAESPLKESLPTQRGEVESTSIIAQGIRPAITGFLMELPSKGKSWTSEEQRKWIDAFTAMIMALYPSEG